MWSDLYILLVWNDNGCEKERSIEIVNSFFKHVFTFLHPHYAGPKTWSLINHCSPAWIRKLVLEKNDLKPISSKKIDLHSLAKNENPEEGHSHISKEFVKFGSKNQTNSIKFVYHWLYSLATVLYYGFGLKYYSKTRIFLFFSWKLAKFG